MAVQILEERHPQIVVVHPGDEVRLRGESEAALLEFANRERDVGATEIGAAARRDVTRIGRLFGEQTHAGAVEERQVAEAVELPEPDDLPIEGLGPVDVGHGQGDVADMAEIKEHDGPPYR